jgi:YggT family protein
MFVLANTLSAIVVVLASLLNIYFWIVIISAVLTWVRPDPYNPIIRTLRALTEPVFYRVRKWLPFTYMNGLDFSPVVVLLAIELVNRIVIVSLSQYVDTLQRTIISQ